MKFFLIISVLLFLIIMISALFGRQVYAAKYKKQKLWITGTGKEYRNSLPEFTR